MDQNQRREYLFQRDLELEKQMEKTIKGAQPKPKPDMTLKLLKPIKINTDLLTGTPEYQAQKQLSDLELDQQLNNTIKQAIRTAENKPPVKFTNAVSQEMIDEYRKEAMKPIDIKGKKFLYRSVEIPPIPKPADTPFLGTERTEDEARQLIEDTIADITILEEEYDRKVEKKRRLEATYTASTAVVFDEVVREAELMKSSIPVLKNLITERGYAMPKGNKQVYIDRIIENEKNSANLRAQIDKTELDTQNILESIRKKKDLIDKVQADYALQIRVEEENRLKKVEHENLQRQQNEELLNDFNRLNKGRT